MSYWDKRLSKLDLIKSTSLSHLAYRTIYHATTIKLQPCDS